MRDIAAYAIEAMVKAGADKAACKAASGRKDEFNVDAGKFSLLRTLYNDELSLTAIKDSRKGTISVNKLDKDSINKAVEECVALAASAAPDEAEDIAPLIENKNFSRKVGGADMDRLFSRSKELVEQAMDEFPGLSLDLYTEFNSGKTAYVNNNGVEFTDEVEYYMVRSLFTAKDGEDSSSFNYYGALTESLDTPFMNLGMQRTLFDESVRSTKTRMVDEKFVGKIIVSPACDYMMWNTLLDCFLGTASLVNGTSRWKDALGALVTDKKFTFRAAPLHPDIVASERFTTDGFASTNTDLIRDGVLTSFALNLYGANKTGKPRAGNTGFNNIEVAAGDTSLADMIKGVDKGILINRFSGASPGPSGDISGVAKNSFLIENGQVTDALSETMLAFNVLDVLQNIPAISKEQCINGMYVMPWCCFDGVTISGK